MPANEYQFLTRWVVGGTTEEVFAIRDDPEEMARWWPSTSGGRAVGRSGN